MIKELFLSTFLVFATGVSSLSYDLTPSRAFEREDLSYDYINSSSADFVGQTINYSTYKILVPYNSNLGITENYSFRNDSLTYYPSFNYYGFVGSYGYNLSNNFNQNIRIANYVQYLEDIDNGVTTIIAQCVPIFQFGEDENNYIVVYALFYDNYFTIARFGNMYYQENDSPYIVMMNVSLNCASVRNNDYFHKNYSSINLSSHSNEDINFWRFDYYIASDDWLTNTFSFDLNISIYGDNQVAYQNGYTTGYTIGYENGETYGYNQGLEESYQGLLLPRLFMTILDTPILVIRSLFDFNVFGVSLFALFGGLLTILVMVFVIGLIIKFIK